MTTIDEASEPAGAVTAAGAQGDGERAWRQAALQPPLIARESADQLTSRRVVPQRHTGRWIATAVVLVLVAQLVNGLVTNPFYQWHTFGYWFARPVILQGLVVTLKVAALSAVYGFVGGVVLDWAGCPGTPCCAP